MVRAPAMPALLQARRLHLRLLHQALLRLRPPVTTRLQLRQPSSTSLRRHSLHHPAPKLRLLHRQPRPRPQALETLGTLAGVVTFPKNSLTVNTTVHTSQKSMVL